MATSKCYYPRPSHRFLSSDQHVATTASDFELDEWDLYKTDSDSASGFSFSDLTITSGRTGLNRTPQCGLISEKFDRTSASSLPVNVPDWSKILGKESRGRKYSYDEVDGEEIACGQVPPHELLARRRMASFSVHEGVGSIRI